MEVGQAQATAAGALAQVGEPAGELVQAVAIGVVDDGDEDALVGAGGDADVDVGPFGDVVALATLPATGVNGQPVAATPSTVVDGISVTLADLLVAVMIASGMAQTVTASIT